MENEPQGWIWVEFEFWSKFAKFELLWDYLNFCSPEYERIKRKIFFGEKISKVFFKSNHQETLQEKITKKNLKKKWRRFFPKNKKKFFVIFLRKFFKFQNRDYFEFVI